MRQQQAEPLTRLKMQIHVKNENLASAVKAVTVNNTIYGYPITADNGYFLYYNKKYLKASDVKSLDRILSIAAKNNKKFARIGHQAGIFMRFMVRPDLRLN